MRHVEAWEEQNASELKFKPTISEASKRIAKENSQFRGENKDFLRRQQNRQAKKQAMLNRGDIKTTEERECTFKPAIGNANEVLRKSRPNRLGETEVELVDRLAKQDVDRKRGMRKAMQRQYHSQFKFKPKINKISKQLVIQNYVFIVI